MGLHLPAVWADCLHSGSRSATGLFGKLCEGSSSLGFTL